MPRNPDKRPCSVEGCKAWAMRGSDPPRCAPHTRGRTGAPPDNRNALVHGFYASALHPDDLQDLDEHAVESTLDGEILIIRFALRRLQRIIVTGLTPGPDPRPLDPGDYARFFGLTCQATNTLSRLLRVRHDLPDTSWEKAIGQALDELGAELGLPL